MKKKKDSLIRLIPSKNIYLYLDIAKYLEQIKIPDLTWPPKKLTEIQDAVDILLRQEWIEIETHRQVVSLLNTDIKKSHQSTLATTSMIHRKKIQPEFLKGKGKKKSRGNFQDFLNSCTYL